jgi:hypothetical protein
MQRGALLEAVRRENRTAVLAALLLCAIPAAVLLFNWKYMYNWAAGPFPFDEALAAAPRAREFVRAEGPLLPTGLTEETTFRLFRGAVESKSVSANYMAMLTAGRFLVVKLEPSFSGKVVEGRLVPLPEAVRSSLLSDAGRGADGTRRVFHPYLLEQKNYRLDANLFVMIATPLFPVTLLLLVVVAWQAARPERHASLKRLARLGPLSTVVPRVETALALAGDKAKAGPLWITREWVAALGDKVLVYPASELVGVGLKSTLKKTRSEVVVKHTLNLWAKDLTAPDTLEVSAGEGKAVLEAVAERLPWALIDDGAAFERRWSEDRAACAREAEARRKGAPVAGPPPTARA